MELRRLWLSLGLGGALVAVGSGCPTNGGGNSGGSTTTTTSSSSASSGGGASGSTGGASGGTTAGSGSTGSGTTQGTSSGTTGNGSSGSTTGGTSGETKGWSMQLLDHTAARNEGPFYLSRDSAGDALAAWSAQTDDSGQLGFELRVAFYSSATHGWSGYQILAANLPDGGTVNGGYVQLGGAQLGPSGLGLAAWLGASGYHGAHLSSGSTSWTDDGALFTGTKSALTAASPLAIAASEDAELVTTTQCGDGGGQFGVQVLGYHGGRWDTASTSLATCGQMGIYGLAGAAASSDADGDGGFAVGWVSGPFGAMPTLGLGGSLWQNGSWTALTAPQPVPGIAIAQYQNCSAFTADPLILSREPQIVFQDQNAWMIVETTSAPTQFTSSEYLSSLTPGALGWGAPLLLGPSEYGFEGTARFSINDQGPIVLTSEFDAGLGNYDSRFSLLPSDGGAPVALSAVIYTGFGLGNVGSFAVSGDTGFLTVPYPVLVQLDGGLQSLPDFSQWIYLPAVGGKLCGLQLIPLSGGAALGVWSGNAVNFTTLRYDPSGGLPPMPDTGGLAAGSGGFEPNPDGGLQTCDTSSCQGVVATACFTCAQGKDAHCTFSAENLFCCNGTACDGNCLHCADNPDAGVIGCASPFYNCCNDDTGINVIDLIMYPGAAGYYFPQDLCPNTWACATNCAPIDGEGPNYTICNPSSFGCGLTLPAFGNNPATTLLLPTGCNSSGGCDSVNDEDFECVICDAPPGPIDFLALCLPPGAGC
jgi:hypothetical protein